MFGCSCAARSHASRIGTGDVTGIRCVPSTRTTGRQASSCNSLLHTTEEAAAEKGEMCWPRSGLAVSLSRAISGGVSNRRAHLVDRRSVRTYTFVVFYLLIVKLLLLLDRVLGGLGKVATTLRT